MPTASSAEIDISVVICTRNRAAPLAQLLESMTGLTVPDRLRWELLIVDNGSTDTTRAVIESFEGRLPIRYVREHTPGLSNARNCGVAAARGRYICWTDDDVEIDTGWLAAYADAFAAYPDDAVFGGVIEPKLQQPATPWFARLVNRWPVNGIVAKRDFGSEAIPLGYENDRVPWGANFAIRAAEQKQHLYDPHLGVSPVQRRSGEESQVIFEILSGGATGRWTPRSKVFHIFPIERQSLKYTFVHFHAIGETQAYLDSKHHIHYMNRDGKQPRLVYENPLKIFLLMKIYSSLYEIFRLVGLRLRSLYYLRRAAMYSGVVAFRKSVSGDLRAAPAGIHTQ